MLFDLLAPGSSRSSSRSARTAARLRASARGDTLLCVCGGLFVAAKLALIALLSGTSR
jgi:hypothetical protein